MTTTSDSGATPDLASRLGPIHVGIRKDLRVTRQRLGGDVSYVMHDPVTFENHSFTVTEYRILSAIVTQRTLAETFQDLLDRGEVEATDEPTFYDFVVGLHEMRLLQLPIIQADALFDRHERKREARRANWYRALMYWRIPLIDPDPFLSRTLHWFGWMFSRVGIALWALLLLAVVWKCAGRFGEMVTESASLLAISNLPIIWIALVVLKVIHEFGHAYACKKLGGEVPEMGAVFILLTPCAYVDASASWKFPDRRHRVLVALGGMYVESIVAAFAALVWASSQPGFVHDVALNIVVLAGVMTVFLNLNPLMKFDGYFVFSDLSGVVNLQERALRYLKGWFKHWTLGMPRPVEQGSTRVKLLYAVYGPSCFAYRVLLAFTMTTLIMMQWPSAGLLLGLAFAWMLIVQPVMRLFSYLLKSKETAEVRGRARWLMATSVGLTAILLAFLPVSGSVVVPGTLDPGVRRTIRAPASGFVDAIHLENGARIGKGEVICEMSNPELEAKLTQSRSDREVARVRLDAYELDDPTASAVHAAHMEYLESRVSQLERRLKKMKVASDVDGTIVSAKPIDLLGRFVREGEEMLRVHSSHRFVRVVLTDKQVARARLEVGSQAEIRWACAPMQTVRATVREIRRSSARSKIPIELTVAAGGEIYAKPLHDGEAVAEQPYLHVFLEVETAPGAIAWSGMTARVRLEASTQTLGGWIQDRVVTFLRSWMMS